MRPRYHYAPASNWLSDPNGLVFHDGEWHLFYQYNPHAEDWGHMSWGHAVSRDLVHWEELPVALHDDDRHMIFSGSAVIDRQNSAGFGGDAMVAIYTGAMAGEPPRQVQCLAASTDRGRSWAMHEGNPVIDLDLADFRDPNVFWHEAGKRWIMVVALSNENRALIYASRDLKHWDQLSEISGQGAPGEVWECPLLIELPVEGREETRWLFKVDVLRDGPGSGAIYATGDFDGAAFAPDSEGWKVADWGRDFYAAVAWHAPRDRHSRPVWIGWMGNHAYQGQLPRKGWRGAMSLPRRMSLCQGDGGLLLRQEIVDTASAALAQHAASPVLPMASRLRLTEADWRLTLTDPAGREIEVQRCGADLRVLRRDTVSDFLNADCTAALASDLPVEVWLDAGSIELIADGGLVSLTLQHLLQGETVALQMDVAETA